MQKREYDAFVGGHVTLNNHVPTYRYAASAFNEIKALLDSVKYPDSTKLIFQALPKHMRRRAMSHQPKRLPRKYRSAHQAQMTKAGKPVLSKRPSRKYRRRPKNLLSKYLRRQRRNIWLETHLWHAKRFHMTNRWGYRLPYASCSKTYRACYRASVKHCLLQDISYYTCLELKGHLDILRAGFARLSNPNIGLSIGAATYLSGRREGSVDLYQADQYPNKALGQVYFMWQSLESCNKNCNFRALWLWTHPSTYQTILNELIEVFHLISAKTYQVPIKTETQEAEFLEEKRKTKFNLKEQRCLQFMTRTAAIGRFKKYVNVNNSVMLTDLKDNLNRFRLTGYLAQAVLKSSFDTYSNTLKKSDNWFNAQCAIDSVFKQSHNTQSKFWLRATKHTSPTEFLANVIIGLNIVDPRLQCLKNTTATLNILNDTDKSRNSMCSDLFINSPNQLCTSILWDSELRSQISSNIVSCHELSNLRAKHAVVPGAISTFESKLQPVPVILIQRPGSQNSFYKCLGYGCGWDVIVPAGYGMIVWLTLIRCGAKPGGLRELDTIARESGVDLHLPDTIPGQQLSALHAIEAQTKYFRQPPNKRCNYSKLNIISPFRPPLLHLVRDWLPDLVCANTFHIIRNRQLLTRFEEIRRYHKMPFPNFEDLHSNGVIQIQIRLNRRGNLHKNSLICLPDPTDIKSHIKHLKLSINDPVHMEPLIKDPNENLRHKIRLEHKRILKRLRARRVREKRKLQETKTGRVHIRAANTATLVSKNFREMCELWVPSETITNRGSVRKQCTRDVIGYITSANFCNTEGTVCGVGYITPFGLRAVLQLYTESASQLKQSPMCLVRDTQSRHYRFATFKINTMT